MLRRILREPLVHFLLLGGLLFAVYGWLGDDAPPPPDEIVIDTARVEFLQTQFERVWLRPPTDTEMRGLIDSWLREEIFYREGLALGLDQGDPVVRRRIAQKMDFISEGLGVAPPSDEELEAYLAANAEKYQVDPVYTLRQVYFDPGSYADEWAGAAAAANAALESGSVPEPTGGSLLPDRLEQASAREVGRVFGQEFTDALAAAPVGRWHGPVQSGYGVHLVYLEKRVSGRLPSLVEVRGAVEQDLLTEQREAANEALYRSLRARYTIRYEGVAEPAAVISDGAGGTGRP